MRQRRPIDARSPNRVWWLAVVIGAVVTVAAQNPDDLSSSVVRITTPMTQGSGVVVAVDVDGAVILTAYHVIANAERINVVFGGAPGRGAFEVTAAALVGWQSSDETYGLAAFRVRGPVPNGVRAAMLGTDTTLQRGDPLVYWGYPNRSTTLQRFGLNLSATEGTNFSTDRSVGGGASGGAIVKDGRVVGIAAARDAEQTYGVMSQVAAIALRYWGITLPDSPVRSPAAPETAASGTVRRAGDVFRDCADCPEMVVIPAGKFTMGSPASEEGRDTGEGPTREVSVPSFALGRYEVTRAQFQAYATGVGAKIAGCRVASVNAWVDDASRSWQSPGFEQTPSEPVVCVNWDDMNAFVKWLGLRARQTYRLASEAEWEYAARAGTTTSRYWGNSPSDACAHANVVDETVKKYFAVLMTHACSDGVVHTAPAGRFKPNAFGVYDILGNAWEWTQDCWNDNYTRAPTGGGPWTTGDCSRRVVRGGSWISEPRYVRAAFRVGNPTSFRDHVSGFRVARALP
jgi:formylglycine-generating enzyme required for sulfatase activity